MPVAWKAQHLGVDKTVAKMKERFYYEGNLSLRAKRNWQLQARKKKRNEEWAKFGVDGVRGHQSQHHRSLGSVNDALGRA